MLGGSGLHGELVNASAFGLAASQIVDMPGGVSVPRTRDSSKRDTLLAAGARHVIATSEQDVVDEVRKVTGGKGARIAFDPLGRPEVPKIPEALSPLCIFFQYRALDFSDVPVGRAVSALSYSRVDERGAWPCQPSGLRTSTDWIAEAIAIKGLAAAATLYEPTAAFILGSGQSGTGRDIFRDTLTPYMDVEDFGVTELNALTDEREGQTLLIGRLQGRSRAVDGTTTETTGGNVEVVRPPAGRILAFQDRPAHRRESIRGKAPGSGHADHGGPYPAAVSQM